MHPRDLSSGEDGDVEKEALLVLVVLVVDKDVDVVHPRPHARVDGEPDEAGLVRAQPQRRLLDVHQRRLPRVDLVRPVAVPEVGVGQFL